MTVKIDAMVGEVPQTFEYGNLFAREDVGGHARLWVGLMPSWLSQLALADPTRLSDIVLDRWASKNPML